MKKLYRSKENRVLAGIFGGLGEYLEVDPVILRLFWHSLYLLLLALCLGLFFIWSLFLLSQNSRIKNEKG